METLAPRLSSAIAPATVALWAPQERATLTLYNNNCVSCHSSATTTCNGCHAHGVHSSSAKNDINLTGTTDKVSYAPGSPVKVTVNAGYRTDWVRVVLFDQNLQIPPRTHAANFIWNLACERRGHAGCSRLRPCGMRLQESLLQESLR